MKATLNNQIKEENEVEIQTCIICYSDDILETKCKIQCLNCGYKRDCSDP